MSPNFGRLTMIGAGNMGGAILSGLVAQGADPSMITAVEASKPRRDQLAADLGINVTADVAQGVAQADVIMVAVKPKQVAAALGGLPVREGVLVVSIAAGVSTEVLEGLLPTARVVRVMPNTAALVGQGMAGISGGASARDEDVDLAVELLSSVGTAVVVPESQQDLITATSGSGIAYLFLVAEAMIESAVALGLTRAQAGDIVRQTFVGATEMLATGEHPVILREQVTSPGGTTAAALATLEAHGLRTAFLDAMTAVVEKSSKLV